MARVKDYMDGRPKKLIGHRALIDISGSEKALIKLEATAMTFK